MPEPYAPNPQHFDRLPNQEGQKYHICKVCPAQKPRRTQNCKSHENSRQHRYAIEFHRRQPRPSPPPQNLETTVPNTDHALSEDALLDLLFPKSSDSHQPLYPREPSEPYLPASRARSPSPFRIDWDLYALEQARQDGETLSSHEQYCRQLRQTMSDLLNGNIRDHDAGIHHESSSDGTSTNQDKNEVS